MNPNNRFPSYSSYDYQPVTCVPVIASFNSDGNIAPLYIRINGESFKIDSFWIRPNSFKNVITYNCKLIVHGYLKPLSIEYHVRECTWTVTI